MTEEYDASGADASDALSEPLIAANDEDAVRVGDHYLTSPLLLQEEEEQVQVQVQVQDETILHDRQRNDDGSTELPSYTVISEKNPKEYYDILLMSIFTMTFMMLVLGSYFFEWSDTVLSIQVDTLVATKSSSISSSYVDYEERRIERGQTISVNVPLYTDATFQTTLGIFQSSHSNMIVFLIITSSIIAPIMFTILQPIFILIITSYKAPSEIEFAQSLSYKFKNIVNLIFSQQRIGQILTLMRFVMKFSMSLVFVNSILNVCTSKVGFILGGDFGPINNNNSSSTYSYPGDLNRMEYINDHLNDGNSINIQVKNSARGGLISYMIGFSIFGIGALILIQSYLESKIYHLKDEIITSDIVDVGDFSDDDVASGLNSNDGGATILSPPRSAFRHHEEYFLDSDQYVLSKDESFLCDSTMGGRNYIDDSDTGLGSSTGITPNCPNTNFPDEQFEHTTPLLNSENKEDEQESDFNVDNNGEKTSPSIKDIAMYECGLLLFILLIPIAQLPLIEIEHSGFLKPLLSRKTLESTSFTLWNLANANVSSNNFGRDLFGLISIVCFWANVIVIPLFTWVCCTLLWLSMFIFKKASSTFTTKILHIVKLVHPCSFMIPFALSLFVTISSLKQVTDFLFNQNTFCSTVQNVLGLDESVANCLMIDGRILPGGYILLLHGLFLDIFVYLVFI